MRDRLIEMIQNSVGGCARHWAEIVADHLLANGVIVPPCKMGDKAHRLFNGKAKIVEGMILDFAITHEPPEHNRYRFSFWVKADEDYEIRHHSPWCDFEDFGKTVFLTREEAEKALKGGETDA